MRFSILAFVGLLCSLPSSADQPEFPYAYVASSPGGRFYFRMVPTVEGSVDRSDGFGIAYRVGNDESDEILWRTEGWYSFEVFLSFDGRCLVAMGPWNGGSRPSNDHLALAFYRDGKLLREYSTADLVEDGSKVTTSASHYTWLARDAWVPPSDPDPNHEPRFVRPVIFELTTVDGIVYRFDATSGAIVEKKKP